MFLWTSLPSFSTSTQREHSIITVEKRDIRRSTQNIIALVKPLLFSNLRVGQKKMHSFGGRPRAHSNIIVIYSIVALIKTLGSMFLTWRLGYSYILFLWWPFPDIPNEGDWWVRDRLLPSFSEKGVSLASSYFTFLRLVPGWIRVRGW